MNGSQGVWAREMYDRPPLCLFSLCLPGIIRVITCRRDTESSLFLSFWTCFLPVIIKECKCRKCSTVFVDICTHVYKCSWCEEYHSRLKLNHIDMFVHRHLHLVFKVMKLKLTIHSLLCILFKQCIHAHNFVEI